MRILAIGAHPDDIELGCQGTIQRLKDEGHEVKKFTAGLGRGDEFDNKFDSKPLLYWVQIIEQELVNFLPDIIFTHSKSDLNIDHCIVYDAVLTATRPMSGEVAREIYSFEILSSTEWNFPTTFSPNVFYELSEEYLYIKQKVLREQYSNEMRTFPHPRNPIGIEVLARYRGMSIGVKYAEAFELVRIIR